MLMFLRECPYIATLDRDGNMEASSGAQTCKKTRHGCRHNENREKSHKVLIPLTVAHGHGLYPSKALEQYLTEAARARLKSEFPPDLKP
jgi:hypothetical protein